MPDQSRISDLQNVNLRFGRPSAISTENSELRTTLIPSRQAVRCRTQQRRLRVENHMHRHTLQYVAKATLVEKCLHKVRLLKHRQNSRWDAAADIDATRREHLQR